MAWRSLRGCLGAPEVPIFQFGFESNYGLVEDFVFFTSIVPTVEQVILFFYGPN
jgi:hypothetical protein